MTAIAVYLCLRRRCSRRGSLFDRGVTPIGDEEIASWKVKGSNVNNEKVGMRPIHASNTSTFTHRKAPSLIQYQTSARPSLDIISPQTPRSFVRKQSFDLPQSPPMAVLAKAPNSRSGLTDEAVPGDDPFLPSPKRMPSKISKLPPSSPTTNHRTRGSRSSSVKSLAEARPIGDTELSPTRTSTDIVSPSRGQSRIYSTSTAPPRLSFHDNDVITKLSPPPTRRNDIGWAIG